jgi:magnesium chelatase family protein
MPRVPPALLGELERPEGSAAVAARIAVARDRQAARTGRLNARVAGRALRAICGLDRPAEARVAELAEAAELSARAAERLLRVARTIADLAGAEIVATNHLEEAARYRDPALSLSRQGAA